VSPREGTLFPRLGTAQLQRNTGQVYQYLHKVKASQVIFILLYISGISD